MAWPPSKEERAARRARVQSFIKSGYWTGVSFVLAGAMGALALFEFRAGPLIAGLVGLSAYALLAYGLPRRVAQSDKETAKAPPPSNDPRVELLVEAHQHSKALTRARTKLPADVAETVKHLAKDAGVIIAAVTEQPEKLTPVLRFFTYYLPATADLVADRVKLAPHAGDARLTEIDETLARLKIAFANFKAAVIAPDLTSVDIDISLLDDALDAELEATSVQSTKD